MKKAFLKAIDYVLPQCVVTNEELVAEFPEWTVEKIADKVGVKTRHVAAKDETAVDMAVRAAEKLFDAHLEITRDSIDFVIFCTQSPDYILPTSACIIQHRLGLPRNIGAFDYNLGCSGYVYGLAIAKGLITGGVASNVLLLTAETYTHRLHPRDKGNRTIFGDAATASVISTEGVAEIGDFVLGTDGAGAENLIVKTGGARCPEPLNDTSFDENGNPVSSDHIFMNGAEIFMFTQRNVPAVVKETLVKNNLTLDDLSLVIFHQANAFMLNFLRKKIKIPSDKFFVNMDSVGNTVSNSIPLAICDAYARQPLHGPVLICGFGVGYSWGACTLNFK